MKKRLMLFKNHYPNWKGLNLLKPLVGMCLLLVVFSSGFSQTPTCITYYNPDNSDHSPGDRVSKSVVFFSHPLNAGTGILINNTNNDGKAYVLTTGHNVDMMDLGGPDGVISEHALALTDFYFNRKWINGSLHQEGPITGARIVAISPGYYPGTQNDWVLIELSSSPVLSCYDVTFLGWDAQNNSIGSIAILGHPARHPLSISNHLDYTADNTYVQSELSTGKEQAGGSSGAPMFGEASELLYALYFMGRDDYSCSVPYYDNRNMSSYPGSAARGIRFKYLFDSNSNFKAILDPQNKLAGLPQICPSLSPGDINKNACYVNPIYEVSAKTYNLNDSYLRPGSIIGGYQVILSSTKIFAGSQEKNTRIIGVNRISGNCVGTQQRSLVSNSNVNKVFQNESQISQLQILPNPIVNSAQVTFTTEKVEKIKLSIWNMFGEQVKVITDETLGEGNQSIDFETSDIRAGLYLLVKESSSGKATQKILITR